MKQSAEYFSNQTLLSVAQKRPSFLLALLRRKDPRSMEVLQNISEEYLRKTILEDLEKSADGASVVDVLLGDDVPGFTIPLLKKILASSDVSGQGLIDKFIANGQDQGDGAKKFLIKKIDGKPQTLAKILQSNLLKSAIVETQKDILEKLSARAEVLDEELSESKKEI